MCLCVIIVTVFLASKSLHNKDRLYVGLCAKQQFDNFYVLFAVGEEYITQVVFGIDDNLHTTLGVFKNSILSKTGYLDIRGKGSV